ncbi:uncharacterized protein AMSG_10317 [Thecamonas trahens ATCC 50062]|uniref:Uncharacterized protein n=1 Tax=Thecamonas trahens ATCC 50062 TaxID=461836 RepID=A0A0L0DPU7_THETB|nr:hypothetical protein AMSG_10317 [Thecamonas trahens ATCC 50062]KNC54329.1 hypothetical protein AMSG_10317 [Thecamonas trahens ATCC 50062]|eukprot:XP_013753787.1 hypothetical protein AMSG_10317 [Thecamonas trahens ATCC 50062]
MNPAASTRAIALSHVLHSGSYLEAASRLADPRHDHDAVVRAAAARSRAPPPPRPRAARPGAHVHGMEPALAFVPAADGSREAVLALPEAGEAVLARMAAREEAAEAAATATLGPSTLGAAHTEQRAAVHTLVPPFAFSSDAGSPARRAEVALRKAQHWHSLGQMRASLASAMAPAASDSASHAMSVTTAASVRAVVDAMTEASLSPSKRRRSSPRRSAAAGVETDSDESDEGDWREAEGDAVMMSQAERLPQRDVWGAASLVLERDTELEHALNSPPEKLALPSAAPVAAAARKRVPFNYRIAEPMDNAGNVLPQPSALLDKLKAHQRSNSRSAATRRMRTLEVRLHPRASDAVHNALNAHLAEAAALHAQLQAGAGLADGTTVDVDPELVAALSATPALSSHPVAGADTDENSKLAQSNTHFAPLNPYFAGALGELSIPDAARRAVSNRLGRLVRERAAPKHHAPISGLQGLLANARLRV